MPISMTAAWRVPCALALCLALCGLPSLATAQPEEVAIETMPLGGGVFLLIGQGGNIGLSVGEDGAFLIDDQFAPLSARIEAAIAAVSDEPVRFLVNTHWHGDHTGGNEHFANAGAVIVAHENVRQRLSSGGFIAAFDRQVPPAPAAALPVVTFADALTFHWNGGTIRVFHIASAHTDGDAAIHFVEANVLHTGDVFFNGLYPFIDTSSGGSINGVIAGSEQLLTLIGEETRIIPGHGPLGDADALRAYRDMLVTVRDRIGAMIDEGKTLEEVLAAAPTAEFDAEWGSGFLTPEQWIGIVYGSLAQP